MKDPGSNDVSIVLQEVHAGVPGAQDRLLALVYDELRRAAHGQVFREGPGQTLQTTDLVHEAYLRLMRGRTAPFENRQHFFRAAALAMRRILVDRARRKQAAIHGGGAARVPVRSDIAAEAPSFDVIALNEALERLAQERPRHAEVVGLRYFLGMTVPETAKLLGVSARAVDSDWQFSKSWLKREMGA